MLLLVFEHGFIQIRFGVLEFFCFCFMSNKYFLILLNFTRYLFIDEKHTEWMLDTKVKVFHESISCFMKWPWNCISWNALKEKFQCILPLRKSIFLCEDKDQLSLCQKACWNTDRSNHLFISNWWIAPNICTL